MTLAGAATAALFLTACGSEGDSKAVGGDVAKDCTPAHTFKTVTDGVLTVVPYEFMPYAAVDKATNELKGVDGEVITEIAKRECLKLKVVQLPAASALESVATGQADLVMGGWYKSPEREKEFGQTDAVYYDFSALISKKADDFSSIDDIEGKKLALVQGQSWVKDVQKMFGNKNVGVYQTPDAAVAEIGNGRRDAAFVGAAEGSVILSKKEGLVLNRIEPDDRLFASQETYAINYPHAKTATDLGEALSANIVELREDGSIQKFLEKYNLADPEFFQPSS